VIALAGTAVRQQHAADGKPPPISLTPRPNRLEVESDKGWTWKDRKVHREVQGDGLGFAENGDLDRLVALARTFGAALPAGVREGVPQAQRLGRDPRVARNCSRR